MKQTLQTSIWSFRDMRLVLPARAVSLAGDAVTMVALMLRVSEHGGPTAMTGLMLAFALPLVVMIPVAGRLVDRYDSRLVLVCSSLFQAGAVAGLAFVDGLAATMALVCLLQFGQAVSQPGWVALMPRIVGEELVGRAVGTSQALNGVAMLAGSAAGGLLVGWYGGQVALLVDAASFGLLAVVAVAVRTRRRGTTAEGLPRGAMTGFRVVMADGLLKVLVPGLWIFILAAEAVNVVEVFLVTDDAGLSPSAYGLVLAFQGAGAICGAWLAGRLAGDLSRARALWLGMISLGVGCALMGGSWHPVVLVAAGTLMGASGGLLNAAGNALVVTRSPEAVRGQVTAALIGSSRAFGIAALLLGGYAGHLLGARGTFVAAGVLSAVIGVLLGWRLAGGRAQATNERRHAGAEATNDGLGDGGGEGEIGLATGVGLPGLGEAEDAVAQSPSR